MRSLIASTAAVLLVLAAAATTPVYAFVDFPGLPGDDGPKKTIHPVTGNHHYEHEVDHTFPAVEGSGMEPTFFKAKYSAEHESHWNFVQLHDHIEGMNGVHCGLGEKDEINTVHIQHPSQGLLKQLHEQKSSGYTHTIITAKGNHHCKGTGIFRQLVSVHEAKDTVTLVLKETSYNKVFKNLDLRIDTNHVHQKKEVIDVEATAADMTTTLTHSTDYDITNPSTFQSANTNELQRGMSTQHHHGFLHRVSHACHHAVTKAVGHTIAHAAKEVAHGVDHAAKEVKHVVSEVSDFNVDHSYNLPGLNFNKDVSHHFSAYNAITGDYKLAASFSFHPSVTFILKIELFELKNTESYFTGITNLGATGTFSSTLHKQYSDRFLVTTIPIAEIHFAIGPVPVWLQPSIPIYAGFDVTFDGELEVNALISGHSTVQYGFAYSDDGGFRTIKVHDWTWTHDFGPLNYSANVGINLNVEPEFKMKIESVGLVGMSLTANADIEIQSNTNCEFDLTININPVILLTAGMDLTLLDHKIINKNWGPWSVYSHTFPLVSHCAPWSAKAKAEMALQDGTSSGTAHHMIAQATEVTEHQRIVTTAFQQLTGHNIGKSWSGSAKSLQEIAFLGDAPQKHTVSMEFSAQFTTLGLDGVEGNTTLVYLTLTKSIPTPGIPSTANGETTAHAVMAYTCPQFLEVGKTFTFTLKDIDNATYHQSNNASVLDIVPSSTLTMIVDADDVRFITIDSTMTYGTVAMVSPRATNATSSFNIFAQGYATLENPLDLNRTDVLIVMIYAAVATIGLAIMTIVAIIFVKKFRATKRRAVGLGLGFKTAAESVEVTPTGRSSVQQEEALENLIAA